MTRDETVALFDPCKARRADARAAGAHEAANAHWNAWEHLAGVELKPASISFASPKEEMAERARP
jgi:hypothetical protein